MLQRAQADGVSDHLKAHQLVLPEAAQEGNISSVASAANEHSTAAWDVVARIKDKPALIEIDLKPGGVVDRGSGRG